MIKPIRTNHDLELATERLAGLIKSNEEGAFSDEIEVLATVIEEYERATIPMSATSPVEAIRFRMDQQGLTPRQLEPFIGSRARVSEVLSGKRQLTLDMIRSLHEGLGIPYESLISKRLDTRVSEKPSGAALNRLNALGFELSSAGISSFVRELQSPYAQRALHRKTRTQRAASKMDQRALLLWQAAVLNKSESRRPMAPFDKSVFVAERLRKVARLSVKPDGPRRAIEAFAENGVSTVILPALPGTFLDGAVMAHRDGTPVIGLTLRHERIDNFWFTLLHEAAHISLHYDELTDAGAIFVDDLEIRSEDAFEKEADALAGESLIPKHLLAQVQWDEASTHDDIVALSVRTRVHIAIVAGRWQRDHQNYKKFSRLIERGTIRHHLQDY
jgi:HTH-type transcriptional regulator / antitoxin HigA